VSHSGHSFTRRKRINRNTDRLNRRAFLQGAGFAGAAGLVGLRPDRALAEPPPETTKLRVATGVFTAICFAPMFVAGDGLYQAEGFTDIQYVKKGPMFDVLASGEADIAATDIGSIIVTIDKGQPVVVLTGLHAGCYELFGTDRVHAIRDLEGRRVAVPGLHTGRHLMLSAMMVHVGLDPGKVNWVAQPAVESMRLLAEGKIDAFLGFPPEPQELRAKKVGHLVVSMTTDRPWADYFCCMVFARREFVQKSPVAAKHAMRAILKAANVCTTEPARAARHLVDRGLTREFEYTLQMTKELPYARWRSYDPADTMRFYALRLYEAGMIKSGPNKILAQGTDWRFLNELKKELKG